MDSCSLKREDIAALQVVADPNASLVHGLNVAHMDLRWILDDPPPGAKGPPLPSTSIRRQNPQHSLRNGGEQQRVSIPRAPETMTVVGPTSGDERATAGPSSPKRDTSGDNSPERADKGGASHAPPSPSSSPPRLPPSATSQGEVSPRAAVQDDRHDSSGSAQLVTPSAERSVRRRGLKTLAILDHEQICPKLAQKILLDSPRSVFVVLSRGHDVQSLCRADPQDFYNEALRTGVPLDMVQLRIAADNKRRMQRYYMLRDAYLKLCHKVSKEEVIAAIRDHKYGIAVEAAKNRERMSMLPRFAYHGGEDLGLLDEDCQKVLEHSRAKTVEEIRRGLELHEKKQSQMIERERSFQEDASGFEAERRAAEIKERDRRDRGLEIKRRADEFRQRILRVREEQAEEVEELRRKVEVREHENEVMRMQHDAIRRSESLASLEAQHAKREIIKRQVQEREEERREALIRRSEFMSKLHQRDLERKRERKVKEARELKEINASRARAIRQIAAMQLEEKRLRSEDAIEQSNQRAEEFKRIRAMRFEARKKALEEKTERGAVARKNAEEKRSARARELAEEYERKQQYIAEMHGEHEQQLALQKELSKQTRIVQLEEQHRCQSVTQFRSIGYLADAEAKAEWLEREHKKRELLSIQVRQERDALYRARDMILEMDEEEEVRRRKESTFSRLNATV